MQTTAPKKEEVVRLSRPSGPLHFAEQAEATPQRPQQEFAYAYPAAPIAFAPQPTYGLPPSPTFASLIQQPATWNNWPQAQAFASPIQTSGGNVPALLSRYTPTLQSPSFSPNAQRQPAADIVDEGAEYVCQVEMPGVKRENIDISCFEHGLLVTAIAVPDIDVGALVQSERGTSISFRRVLHLPGQIHPSKVSAKLHDGILTINLPKSSPTEGPRHVPIN